MTTISILGVFFFFFYDYTFPEKLYLFTYIFIYKFINIFDEYVTFHLILLN